MDTSYYTFAGTLTKVTGNMTWKVGAEHWVLQQANKGIGTQGVFTFDNSNWTRQNALNGGGTGVGSNAASFLLGLPTSGTFPRNADAFWSQHFEAFYVQNDWRVTPRLTINMGLRYDWETPVTERFNRMTTDFDPTVVNPMSDAAQAAYTNILNRSRQRQQRRHTDSQTVPAGQCVQADGRADCSPESAASRAESIKPTGRRFSRASGSLTSSGRTP